MDLENHHFLYFFEKQKNTYTERKVKLSISYKDFHCFELMGFAHVRFLPFKFLKKSKKNKHAKKHAFQKTVLKPT